MMLFAGRRGYAQAQRHRLRAGVAEASVQAECESYRLARVASAGGSPKTDEKEKETCGEQ